MVVISKHDAKAKGLVRYFTGESCRNGHVSERRTHSGHCISCVDASKRLMVERLGPQGLVEKQRAWDAAYKAKNPEKKHKASRDASLRLLERDPEYYRDSAKSWRNANREKFRENYKRYMTKWEAEYPMAAKLRRAAARAATRVKNSGIVHVRGMTKRVRDVWIRSGGKCAVCGCCDGLELDHIRAIAKGGDNAESNLQFLCGTCNRSKCDRDFDEWLCSRSEPERLAA